MIFDATNTFGKIDFVYHAEQMRVIPNVVWLDDATLRYCVYKFPFRINKSKDDLVTLIRKAKKSEVMLPLRMIVINPIEGANYGNAEEEISIANRSVGVQQFGRGTRSKPR